MEVYRNGTITGREAYDSWVKIMGCSAQQTACIVVLLNGEKAKLMEMMDWMVDHREATPQELFSLALDISRRTH